MKITEDQSKEFAQIALGLWEESEKECTDAMVFVVNTNPLPPVVARMPEVISLMMAVQRAAFVFGATITMHSIASCAKERMENIQ